MQRFVLKNKNKITLISGVLIIIAFTNKWLLNNNDLFITSLILASLIAVMPIAIQAYQALRVKVVSIDLLVTIAVIGAFFIKNFEESAIVTFLFLFGAYLEQRTLNHTRSAIKELTDLSPDTAFKKTVNGEFEEVDVEDVDIGDILLVKTGAKVPVDGTIIIGEAIIDQSSITGEPVPVRKVKGANVFAGTIVDNGTIQVVASKVGEETTFGKIIELVEEAQDSKSEAERFIDKFSKWYTPVILIIGIIVWIVSKNVELAITILVLGCPGALVIGVPVSNIASIGNGARNGILIKGSEVIDDLSKLDTIIFDKTGTLTIGSPSVDEKFYFDDNINYYSSLLASIEKNSDHPLAKAVLEDIENTKYFDVDNIKVLKGEGIRGDIDGKSVLVGNLSSMEKENVELEEDVREKINLLESQGNSIVMMSVDKKLKVLLAIKDKIRPGIKNQLRKLKDLGVKSFIILSGDNK
ncbi:MAG TPA: heavy metal translocating P-type ATPase, partial [Tissierellaceae bacterium]